MNNIHYSEQNEGAREFANLVILEIEKSCGQNFCAADAISIIQRELGQFYRRSAR